MSKQTEYIKKFEALALETGLAFGIFPSIVLAQSILESGWGESELSKNYNNYFGIKCHSYHNCIDLGSGTLWRKYLKPKYSFSDYGLFLKSNSIYENCFDALNYSEFAQCLQDSGYAGSSTTYANKLINIIETYNLNELDNKAFKSVMSLKYRPYYALVLLAGVIWTLAGSRES